MTQESNAKAGWYGGNYWDGQQWVPSAGRRAVAPDSPWGWVLGGFLLGLAGMTVALIGVDGGETLMVLVGWAIAGFAAIMTLVGVIALGVRLGGQHLIYERDQRSEQRRVP